MSIRVRLTEPVDNYPTILVQAGEEGRLVSADSECMWIKLDKYHPELDEWNNELQVWNWSDRPNSELVEVISIISSEE